MDTYQDWSTPFALSVIVMGSSVFHHKWNSHICLIWAIMYYFFDTLYALHTQVGLPWKLIHHVGAIIGAVTVLPLNSSLLYPVTLLFVKFEVVTLITNLSIAYPSTAMTVLFVVAALWLRGYSFVMVYMQLLNTRNLYTIVGSTIASCCIVSHNLAYLYYTSTGSPDMHTLFG